MAATRRRGGKRVRLSDWPILIVICLILPTAFILWRTGMPLDDTFVSFEQPVANSPLNDGSLSRNALSPVACADLVKKSQRNTTDKNNNRLFLRYTKDDPHFWISLHDKKVDPTRWAVLQYGRYYEQEQSKAFIEILANSSAPRVIDVGGNIGWYSLLSAAMGAKVDVFEPNKINFLRTCESVCVNNWADEPCKNIGDLSVSGSKRNGRLRIFPVGIGQKEEVAKFHGGVNNPGQGSIVDPRIKVSSRNSDKYQEIRLVPLDTLATQLGWYQEDIDIMKMDVEGHELDVVLGARSFLKSNRVKNIFMEGDVQSEGDRNKFKEVVRMIAASGYIMFKTGGFTGPTETDVPPIDDNFIEALTYECGHRKKSGRIRKKCNLWWTLPN